MFLVEISGAFNCILFFETSTSLTSIALLLVPISECEELFDLTRLLPFVSFV